MTLTSLTKTGLCIALLTAAAAWQPATGLAQPATAAARQEEVGKLAATLQSPTASQFDKVQACHRLAIIGTKEAVPALAALLSDEKLAHMARYALEPLPDPAADAALRDALGKLTGKLQVGVIDSLGVRRDEKAVDALVKLLGSPDPMIAARPRRRWAGLPIPSAPRRSPLPWRKPPPPRAPPWRTPAWAAPNACSRRRTRPPPSPSTTR